LLQFIAKLAYQMNFLAFCANALISSMLLLDKLDTKKERAGLFCQMALAFWSLLAYASLATLL